MAIKQVICNKHKLCKGKYCYHKQHHIEYMNCEKLSYCDYLGKKQKCIKESEQ